MTAIYEITPAGSDAQLVDALRYQPAAQPVSAGAADEIAFLKIRYKQPDADESQLDRDADHRGDGGGSGAIAGLARGAVRGGGRRFRPAPEAAAGTPADFDYDDVIALAEGAKGADPYGYQRRVH